MRNTFIIFGYRLGVVLIVQILLVLLLIVRLFFLQLIEQQKYKGLSDRNRVRVTLQPALRGNIQDRNKHIIAQSIPYHNARITCKDQKCRDHCRTILLEKGFQFDPENFNSATKSFILKERLTWEEIALLESHKSDLPMLTIQTLYERTYPMNNATPHFLGYTSRIPDDHPYARKLPFSNVGRSGLEKTLDPELFGTPALLEEEVNAHGEVIRTLTFNKGTAGNDITLTIDAKLQNFIYQKLESHKSGAGIVLDAQSGAVLALISFPSINPGIFEKGLSKQQWEKLKNDIQTPLLDKTIMGMYPPGSIIKPLIALAALEEGYITPETRFMCTGVTTIDGQPCHCWKDYGHGSVNLEEALRSSCNIYMYEIARIMPLDKIRKWLLRFGLGNYTHFLPGEQKGLVPSNDWKLKNRKERWRRIDTVFLSIGQGYLLTTPVQLAKMMGQLVNGGNEIVPYILLNEAPKKMNKLEVSERYLKFLVHAMGEVINHPNGTGYRSRLNNTHWKMGGKSGTAQVRKITQRERQEGHHHGYTWEWKEKDHALFAGFAPLSNPKYVVVILVEHGGFGGATAAPIGRDVMEFIIQNSASF